MLGQMPEKIVTMRDVAEKAGVSVAAVSRAINRKKDQVSEKTRARVLAVCDELGYKLNPGIQDLAHMGRNGHMRNIAFVMVGENISAHGYAKAVDGLTDAGNDFNYNILLAHLTGRESGVFDLPSVLREGRGDGILLTGDLDERVIGLIKKLGKPYIILGVYGGKITAEAVNIRLGLNHAVLRIVETLKRAGKERIAFYLGTPSNYFAQEIFLAYQKALRECGLELDKGLVYEGDNNPAHAYAMFSAIMEAELLPFDSIVSEDYRCALMITYLLGVRHGRFGAQEKIILATSRPPGGYMLPVPTIYSFGCFDKIAYQGVKTLLQIMEGKQDFAPLSIEVNAEQTLEGFDCDKTI